MNIDSLSPIQQQTLVSFIQHHPKIVDLGGYDGSLAHWLLGRGATSAVVVDKEKPRNRRRHPSLEYRCCYFNTFAKAMVTSKFDATIISWPPNYESCSRDLIYLLLASTNIIYIGSNESSNMCGTPTLWRYLSSRHIVVSVPSVPHNLIIYNDQPRDLVAQPLTHEEHCGLHAEDKEVVDAAAKF